MMIGTLILAGWSVEFGTAKMGHVDGKAPRTPIKDLCNSFILFDISK